MRLSLEQLHERLINLGLMDFNNKPLSYIGFKNRASVHKYGKVHKIVFVGHPKDNLFGFYTKYGNNSVVLKEAYRMYFNLVKGSIEDYNNGDIQWGNKGIPLGYGNLRSEFVFNSETFG